MPPITNSRYATASSSTNAPVATSTGQEKKEQGRFRYREQFIYEGIQQHIKYYSADGKVTRKYNTKSINSITYECCVSVSVTQRAFFLFSEQQSKQMHVEIKGGRTPFPDLTKEDIRAQLNDRLRKANAEMRTANRLRWRCGITLRSSKARINGTEEIADAIFDKIQLLRPDVKKVRRKLLIDAEGETITKLIKLKDDGTLLSRTTKQLETLVRSQLSRDEPTIISKQMVEDAAKLIYQEVRIISNKALAANVKAAFKRAEAKFAA